MLSCIVRDIKRIEIHYFKRKEETDKTLRNILKPEQENANREALF